MLEKNKIQFASLTALGLTFTLVASLITAWLFVDARYAHAEQVARSINDLSLDIQESSVAFKLEVISDKLQDLYNKEDSGKPLNEYEKRTKTKLKEQKYRYSIRLETIDDFRKENRIYSQ